MGKRKPNRYSSQSAHNQYGISNWLKKIGITDHDLRERLKLAFLEDHGFDFERTNKGKGGRDSFIQNRFSKFILYVEKNRKFFEQNIAFKSIEPKTT